MVCTFFVFDIYMISFSGKRLRNVATRRLFYVFHTLPFEWDQHYFWMILRFKSMWKLTNHENDLHWSHPFVCFANFPSDWLVTKFPDNSLQFLPIIPFIHGFKLECILQYWYIVSEKSYCISPPPLKWC